MTDEKLKLLQVGHPTSPADVYAPSMGPAPVGNGTFRCDGYANIFPNEHLGGVLGKCTPWNGNTPPAACADSPPTDASNAQIVPGTHDYRFVHDMNQSDETPTNWSLGNAAHGDSEPLPKNRVCIWTLYYEPGSTVPKYRVESVDFAGKRIP